MRIYKLSKRPLILLYCLLAGILFIIKFALALVLELIDKYAPYLHFTDDYILLPLWIITALYAVLVLPFYFFKARFTVSSKEITAKGGLIVTTSQFMQTSAVKSVTTVMLPLGRFTGMNFIVLNALGARLLIPFLRRKDAVEITDIVNNSIRSRSEQKQ